MQYLTAESKDIIDRLHILDAWAMERRAKAQEAYERGLYDGYRSCLAVIVERLEEALPRVEADARLPEREEPYASLRERLIAEEMAA